jgi:hypothetical protein
VPVTGRTRERNDSNRVSSMGWGGELLSDAFGLVEVAEADAERAGGSRAFERRRGSVRF